jgi:hypothetical protein
MVRLFFFLELLGGLTAFWNGLRDPPAGFKAFLLIFGILLCSGSRPAFVVCILDATTAYRHAALLGGWGARVGNVVASFWGGYLKIIFASFVHGMRRRSWLDEEPGLVYCGFVSLVVVSFQPVAVPVTHS